LTQRLNEICSRKGIVRDAFFNRLFLLLAAAPKVIDTLLFQSGGSEWRGKVWREVNDDNGYFFNNSFYPLEPMTDPFWAIRSGLEIYAEEYPGLQDYIEPLTGQTIRVQISAGGDPIPPDSVYTTIFEQKVLGQDLHGLSCFFPDWLIPDHDSTKARQLKLDELLGDLELLK
jgi:hypothetical protein